MADVRTPPDSTYVDNIRAIYGVAVSRSAVEHYFLTQKDLWNVFFFIISECVFVCHNSVMKIIA